MKIVLTWNDTFHHGPEGHPQGSTESPFTTEQLRDALTDHDGSYYPAHQSVTLRGPRYPGQTVYGVPAEMLVLAPLEGASNNHHVLGMA